MPNVLQKFLKNLWWKFQIRSAWTVDVFFCTIYHPRLSCLKVEFEFCLPNLWIFGGVVSQERSDLSPHHLLLPLVQLLGRVLVDYLFICGYLQIFSDFKKCAGFQKFENQNVFQAILSNSYFRPSPPSCELGLCRFGLTYFEPPLSLYLTLQQFISHLTLHLDIVSSHLPLNLYILINLLSLHLSTWSKLKLN